MTDHAGNPLDAAWVARKHASYDELVSAQGALWWLQADPERGGIRGVMRAAGGRAEVVTPPGWPVGGWLHAYGGGEFAVGVGGRLWAVSGRDGLVHEVTEAAEPRLVVPDGEGFAYGDLWATGTGLLAVRGGEHGDEIVSVDADGAPGVRRLVASDGFLAAPRLLGDRLAYLE